MEHCNYPFYFIGLQNISRAQCCYFVPSNFTNLTLRCRGYMALEYLHGGTVTAKSDILSLGVIILEVITGHKDYPDVTRTSSERFVELVRNRCPVSTKSMLHFNFAYWYHSIFIFRFLRHLINGGPEIH
uniref:Serine-threonine/tyrosine-protein kinase catalytic domain-containing protein n=1 Tax=Aegilops tauschii subsp. strangulata TaxID=200361 RepID=A0A453EFP7_AEGTS